MNLPVLSKQQHHECLLRCESDFYALKYQSAFQNVYARSGPTVENDP